MYFAWDSMAGVMGLFDVREVSTGERSFFGADAILRLILNSDD